MEQKIEKVEDPADYKGGDSMGYNYEVGDIVTLKKPHPCGSKEWEILRVGADFRLKCMGCGHQIMTARKLVPPATRTLPDNLLKQRRLVRKSMYRQPRL